MLKAPDNTAQLLVHGTVLYAENIRPSVPHIETTEYSNKEQLGLIIKKSATKTLNVMFGLQICSLHNDCISNWLHSLDLTRFINK